MIDARARAVLQAVQKSIKADIEVVKACNANEPERPRDTPEDRELNREVAAKAIVLLKNTAGVLPLKVDQIKTIAVVGPNAKTRTVSGGGESGSASRVCESTDLRFVISCSQGLLT